MKVVLWTVGVPTAALMGVLLGFFSFVVVGLTVPMVIVWPLTLCIGALVAAVAATWTGNLSSPDGTRGRLPAIFLVSEIAAAISAVAVLVLWNSVPPFLYGVPLLVVAAAASIATWRLRGAKGRLGWTGVASLAVFIVGAALLFALSPGGNAALETVLGIEAPMMSIPGGPVSSVSYGMLVWTGLTILVLGTLLVAGSLRSSGHELSRDAGVTLALVGLVPPVFILTIYVGCQTTTCSP